MWYLRRSHHPRYPTCELSKNHRSHIVQQLIDARARFIRHQVICPVIIRAPCTKISWIRRPVNADSVPSHGHLEAPICLLSMVGVHKRRPTRPAGIVPSEGCQSWLPQKQLANIERYMRGGRWQALPFSCEKKGKSTWHSYSQTPIDYLKNDQLWSIFQNGRQGPPRHFRSNSDRTENHFYEISFYVPPDITTHYKRLSQIFLQLKTPETPHFWSQNGRFLQKL